MKEENFFVVKQLEDKWIEKICENEIFLFMLWNN